MARFTASIHTEVSDAKNIIEAAVAARNNFRHGVEEQIIIVRDDVNGVILTHDPVDDLIETHDLNGNEITRDEACLPALRLVK